MYVHYLVKIERHISYFDNALLEQYLLHQAWCEHEVHQVQRKQIDSYDICSKCPLWLKHKLASVLAIGQLYHQPGCTTQLRDVRGLPFPVRGSSKPVSCTFLDNF